MKTLFTIVAAVIGFSLFAVLDEGNEQLNSVPGLVALREGQNQIAAKVDVKPLVVLDDSIAGDERRIETHDLPSAAQLPPEAVPLSGLPNVSRMSVADVEGEIERNHNRISSLHREFFPALDWVSVDDIGVNAAVPSSESDWKVFHEFGPNAEVEKFAILYRSEAPEYFDLLDRNVQLMNHPDLVNAREARLAETEYQSATLAERTSFSEEELRKMMERQQR